MTLLTSKPYMLISFLVCFSILSAPSNCFWRTGHMVIARIAELELENTKMMEQMLNILSIVGPYTKEDKFPFVESASYADYIMETGVKTMRDWHFRNTFINGSKTLTKTEMKKAGLEDNPENIVWSINAAKSVLRNTKTSAIDDQFQKSIYLRYLIHFYGDLHQPLHNVSLVNKDFTKGDQGGNLFIIDTPQVKNLHSLWDSCILRNMDIDYPITKQKFDVIDSLAKGLMKAYPRTQKEIKQRLELFSISDIHDETVQIAIDFVYDGIKPNQKPSAAYLKRAIQVIDKQVILAGYRLSDSLQTLFKDPNVLEKHVKPASSGKITKKRTKTKTPTQI